MQRTHKEQLRDLLYRQTKAVSDGAIQASGQISAEQIEALERLARLVDICNVAQPPPRQRWPMVAALGFTLVIVSGLLFARVSETEIELEAALSEVSFVLPTRQLLSNVSQLSELGASGLRDIQLPRARDRAAQTLHASEGEEFAIRLSIVSDQQREGTVTLAALMLPAGAHVWLRCTEVPYQYRLSLKSPELTLRADVNGPIQMGLSRAPVEQLDFLSPTVALLRPGSNEIDLDLTFPEGSQAAFSPQLSADNLSLFRIDQFMDTKHTVVRRVSTVRSGTLYLESLNGKERPLRPAEGLRFDGSHGVVRTLRLQDNHIALNFHGVVRGMVTGPGESERSLMPTYLEWLQARHGLSLLWGTTLYLLGLIIGALRWWGISNI